MKCNQCGGNRTKDECKLCIMFSYCSAPLVHTDATFLAGMEYNQSQQFNNKLNVADILASDLRKIGGSTKGKVYLSSIAAYPGDPQAWVSDRSDIRRVADERNYTVTGDVTRHADGRAGSDEAPTGHPGLDKKTLALATKKRQQLIRASERDKKGKKQ